MSELTYRDVRMVLALVDGWRTGRIHFDQAGLRVEAVCGSAEVPPPAPGRTVCSPAVGRFRLLPAQPTSGDGTVLGEVQTPVSRVRVLLGSGERVLQTLVRDGDFVQYAQPLATLERQP